MTVPRGAVRARFTGNPCGGPAPRPSAFGGMTMPRTRAPQALLRLLRRSVDDHPPAVQYLTTADLEWPPDAAHVAGDVAFDVPIARCVYPYGASYDRTRWHPFTATLREHREHAGPSSYEASVLRRYYAEFRPATMLELLFPTDVAARYRGTMLARLGTHAYEPILPWSGRLHPPHGEKGLGADQGHQGFGPVSDVKGRLEFRRLVDVCRSIERDGFDPLRGAITGTFVVLGDAYRLVVGSGFHRLAALSVLGAVNVRVRFEPHDLRSVHGELADRWPLVRRGVFDVELARAFVAQLFEHDRFSDEIAPRVEPAWSSSG